MFPDFLHRPTEPGGSILNSASGSGVDPLHLLMALAGVDPFPARLQGREQL